MLVTLYIENVAVIEKCSIDFESGLTVLTGKLAQKGYKYLFAGAMIARDRIMADSEKVQAAVSNITAEAKEITEQYYQKLDREYEEAVAAEE